MGGGGSQRQNAVSKFWDFFFFLFLTNQALHILFNLVQFDSGTVKMTRVTLLDILFCCPSHVEPRQSAVLYLCCKNNTAV